MDAHHQFMRTIDNLARRYGRLPSEIVRDATTLDLEVLHISSGFDVEESAPDQRKQPSQQELQAMLESVRQPR